MHDARTEAELIEEEGRSNRSGNRTFDDVLGARFSRRKALAGSLAAATTTFFGATGVARAGRGDDDRRHAKKWKRKRELIDFRPVPNAAGSGPLPRISADYEYQTLIPWGAPIDPRQATTFDDLPFTRASIDAHLTSEEQAKRIGIGHDGMWYFPLDDRGRDDDDRDDDEDDDDDRRRGKVRWGRHRETGMLCINHEFGSNFHVLGKGAPESLEEVRRSQHAHGVSVVRITRARRGWRVARSRNARRIHVNTPVTFSGPVAGSPLLDNGAGNPYLGTVNNCANGYTPWGTYLTCEENFNGYFGATGAYAASPEQARYGFTSGGFGYGWENFDPRFDLSDPAYANEGNRFGWIVEIDPMDGRQVPVKRTALGRFKHEGVALAVGRGGRAVCYMGDDERFDYIYKFVSSGNWKSMRARGMSPLDHGTLYVARFDDDGSGDWLELTIDDPRLVDAGFSTQEEVLTYVRLAADALGATKMDRPEWTTVAPSGEVFCTLTNNSRRTEADAANPQAPNRHGHIIKWRDSGKFTGTTFEWDIYVLATDTHGTESSFASPDGLWADPDGRLFIETDGGQVDLENNQLLVASVFDDEPSPKRLLTGVTDDEITGLTVTPDRETLFVNTQHPGNGDPGLTNFPVENAVPDGETIPRDCTFVITRRDGGVVGS